MIIIIISNRLEELNYENYKYKYHRAINLLSDLISINSCNPPGNEIEVCEYIEKLLGDKVEINLYKTATNRASIYYDIKGKTDSIIAIVGHIDTVPIGDVDKWETDPHVASIIRDYLYGRGSSDMKSGIAGMLEVTLQIFEKGVTPNDTLRFVYTSDEESGGTGVLKLGEKGVFDDVDFIIVPEPTNNKLGVSEKGALWIEAVLKGKSAHGSEVDEGINAIEAAYKFQDLLKNEFKKLKSDELLGNPTVSLNTIEGGTKVNIVPDNVKANYDIRLLPGSELNDIKTYVEKIIHMLKIEGEIIDVDYEILQYRRPLKTDIESKYFKDFENVIQEKHVGIKYFTDLAYIYNYKPTPFVIYGPGIPEECHTTNEKVYLPNIGKWVEGMMKYLVG